MALNDVQSSNDYGTIDTGKGKARQTRVSFEGNGRRSNDSPGEPGERTGLLNGNRDESSWTPSGILRNITSGEFLRGNGNGKPKDEEDADLDDEDYEEIEGDDDDDDDDDRWSCNWTTIVISAIISVFVLGIVIGALLVGYRDRHNIPFPYPPKHPPKTPPTYPPPPSPPDKPRNPAYLIKARHGAVASENGVCSDIGVDVLRDGGSAVDAAIAANLCVGTINLFSSGIGGGGFMTVRIPPGAHSSKSSVFTVDFRERAPAASTSTMFGTDPNTSRYTGLAVGIPGEIRGLAEAHARWGKLSWKRLFEPSIELAEGWKVGKELDWRLKTFAFYILGDPEWTPTFAPNGRLLTEGEWISRPAYAKTLRTISQDGPDVFYKGSIAQSLVSKINSRGGIATLSDFASYKTVIQTALEGTYRGRKVYTSHAPSSGPVLLHILNLLERFNFLEEGLTPLNVHRVVEALKFGFSARSKICDPAFAGNFSFDMNQIPTKEYAKNLTALITDDTTHTLDYYHPLFDLPLDHGTTHTSAVDRNGMAVALTSTVNGVWGSGIMDPQTGILLNNEMDDFSRPGLPNTFGLWPSPYNYAAPNKRPMSSTAPTIVEHESGTFALALGGSGGSRIFGAITQALLYWDWGFDISQAVERPRLHDQLLPPVLDIESTFDEKTIVALLERGHNVTIHDINLGAAEVQAVAADEDGRITAASDSRKNGIASGY